MIPAGVMLVEFGPLKPLLQTMSGHALSAPGGEKLSLQALTGLPFWVWALLFAIVTAVVGFKRLNHKKGRAITKG